MSGETDKIKGAIKEKVGQATGDKSLETEGKVDRAAGATKEAASNVVNKVADKVREHTS